jgi:hypothetical protein
MALFFVTLHSEFLFLLHQYIDGLRPLTLAGMQLYGATGSLAPLGVTEEYV